MGPFCVFGDGEGFAGRIQWCFQMNQVTFSQARSVPGSIVGMEVNSLHAVHLLVQVDDAVAAVVACADRDPFGA